MANYKKEGGTGVKTYSSDPPTAYPSAWEGQLYYNSSDGSFKFQTLGAGAWSSGGAMPANKWVGMGAGTQTSNVVSGGGTTPPANGNQVNTTSGAITMTLPASPSLGDTCTVIDYAGTADTNNITIGRNSQPIMGTAEDLTVAVERAEFTVVYVDSTHGWLLTDK